MSDGLVESVTVIARSSVAGLRVGQVGVLPLTRAVRALLDREMLEPYDTTVPDPVAAWVALGQPDPVAALAPQGPQDGPQDGPGPQGPGDPAGGQGDDQGPGSGPE